VTHNNNVTDEQSVTGAGDKPLETTVIYHIDGNKIKRVYFIR
jgi:hypothetical protein